MEGKKKINPSTSQRTKASPTAMGLTRKRKALAKKEETLLRRSARKRSKTTEEILVNEPNITQDSGQKEKEDENIQQEAELQLETSQQEGKWIEIMEEDTFEECPDDKIEQVPDKLANAEVIIIGDDSNSEEWDYVFQRRRPASGKFQEDDSRSDDSDSYIREVDETTFSPTIESLVVERDPYEENLDIDIDLVNKVVEQILNEGLDTLASVAQQCSNIERAMIIQIDPLKRMNINNGKSSVPTAANNSSPSIVTGQSSSNSLLSIVFQLSKQLNSKREQWKQQHKELNRVVDLHYQETLIQEEKIKQLSEKLDKITSLILDLMGCRSPSPIYALFLKEQLLNYQMTYIMQDRSS